MILRSQLQQSQEVCNDLREELSKTKLEHMQFQGVKVGKLKHMQCPSIKESKQYRCTFKV